MVRPSLGSNPLPADLFFVLHRKEPIPGDVQHFLSKLLGEQPPTMVTGRISRFCLQMIEDTSGDQAFGYIEAGPIDKASYRCVLCPRETLDRINQKDYEFGVCGACCLEYAREGRAKLEALLRSAQEGGKTT